MYKMKNKLIKSLVAMLIATAFLQGCSKDLGNYDYNEINNVTITADIQNSVSVLQQDTLAVNITLTETMPSVSGYSYEWVLYQSIQAPLTRWVLDTTKSLKVPVMQPPGQYTLDYWVKDKKTGISYRKTFSVTIVGKFNEGWLVLEEGATDCDINMIAPNDFIFRNIYSAANKGVKLPAGSHRVTVLRDRTGVQKLYVLSPSDLTQLYFADFLKVASFNDLFWGIPSIKKPQEYYMESGSSSEVILNNGYPHGMATNVPAPFKLGIQPAGTWDVAPYVMYSIGSGHIFYDNLSQRFYKYDFANMLPFAAPPATAVFNVNNVGKKMLFAGQTTMGAYNCVFKNNSNDSVFVFKLDPNQAQPAADTAFIPAANAPGMSTAKFFVCSKVLPHLYYVSGNKVYLLDIPARMARVVYTLPAGAETTSMKLYINLKVFNDPENSKQIALSTNEGGAGTVYVFSLAPTGDFVNNTYRKVYTGFGKINDIALKWAP